MHAPRNASDGGLAAPWVWSVAQDPPLQSLATTIQAALSTQPAHRKPQRHLSCARHATRRAPSRSASSTRPTAARAGPIMRCSVLGAAANVQGRLWACGAHAIARAGPRCASSSSASSSSASSSSGNGSSDSTSSSTTTSSSSSSSSSTAPHAPQLQQQQQTQTQQLLPPELAHFRANVGICLINEAGLVFAATRCDDPQQHWQLPQGGIDPGETPLHAALRELAEETSIRSSVQVLAEIQEWLPYEFPTSVRCKLRGSWQQYAGQAQRWFLVQFTGDDSEIDIEGVAHREFVEWRWMPLEQLPHTVVAFKREVYERVVAEFGPLVQAIKAGGE